MKLWVKADVSVWMDSLEQKDLVNNAKLLTVPDVLLMVLHARLALEEDHLLMENVVV
jgi:hypothetical protein